MEIIYNKDNELHKYSGDLYLGFNEEDGEFTVFTRSQTIYDKLRRLALFSQPYMNEGVVKKENYGKWFGFPRDPAEVFGVDDDFEAMLYVSWSCTHVVAESSFKRVSSWINLSIPVNELRSLTNDDDVCKGAAIVMGLVGLIEDEDAKAYWNSWASRLRNPAKYVEAFVHVGQLPGKTDPRLVFADYIHPERPDYWNEIALDYLVPKLILILQCQMGYLQVSTLIENQCKAVIQKIKCGPYDSETLETLQRAMDQVLYHATLKPSGDSSWAEFKYIWDTAYYLSYWKVS